MCSLNSSKDSTIMEPVPKVDFRMSFLSAEDEDGLLNALREVPFS